MLVGRRSTPSDPRARSSRPTSSALCCSPSGASAGPRHASMRARSHASGPASAPTSRTAGIL